MDVLKEIFCLFLLFFFKGIVIDFKYKLWYLNLNRENY